MSPTSRALLKKTPSAPPERDSGQLRAAPRRATASEVLVDLLCRNGVDTFFGIPGGPVIPVFDAILTHARAQLIESRQETNGVFAAMGFHRATGRGSAVVVTAGPGASNVVTGVAAAHCERVPMVVICGDVPWASTGKRLLQDTGIYGIGIERMLQGITRAQVRISHAASLEGQVHAALRAAFDPSNPGPVLIVLSVDWAGSAAPATRVHHFASEAVAGAPLPDDSLVQRVAELITGAERPLLILGSGCRRDHAGMARLVDALGVPFVTTPQAKGIVSEEHPLSLRTCGMSASWWARRYMKAGCDVTLVLGTDLDDVSMAGTPPIGDGGLLIHVGDDSSVFGRNYPTELGIVCDVGGFAEALTANVGSRDPSCWQSVASALKAKSPFDAPDFASDASVPIAPHRAVADLERAAGSSAVFVTDIGEHMLFALHYLTSSSPDRFVIHLGLGSMASGVGSAIGLALGNRERRVICICGDGSMQMGGMELLVAVKERLPIVYAVFNDARYNMVYHGYRHNFGREEPWATPTIDFVSWAESMGAVGARIDAPGQITPALLDELTAKGLPVVLDIRHNPDVRIRGDGRLEAVRQMSLMHDPLEGKSG